MENGKINKKEQKYKFGQFIQHKNSHYLHGYIIGCSSDFCKIVYEISDNGESTFINEETIDEFYDVI